MYSFFYGSNMSIFRLTWRAPSARTVSVASLQEHVLRFHKQGRDGSAKCDIEWSGRPEDAVYGVVFAVSAADKRALDICEGLGDGYGEKTVAVTTPSGAVLEAAAYHAIKIDRTLKPFTWYKEHVLRGAREHGLPGGYVALIEAVPAIPDPDQRRHERELSIY